jgi:hypothetical protein
MALPSFRLKKFADTSGLFCMMQMISKFDLELIKVLRFGFGATSIQIQIPLGTP